MADYVDIKKVYVDVLRAGAYPGQIGTQSYYIDGNGQLKKRDFLYSEEFERRGGYK